MISNCYLKVFVRYYRKPIWYPTAPSKLFNIPEHKLYNEKEVVYTRNASRRHLQQLYTFNKFFEEEFYLPASRAGGLPEEFIQQEKITNEKLKSENEAKNQEVAMLRKAYFENQISTTEEHLIELKFSKQEEAYNRALEVDEIIQSKKLNQDSFVTETNIDRLIDEAMSSPAKYDFFIDKLGRINGQNPPKQANQ